MLNITVWAIAHNPYVWPTLEHTSVYVVFTAYRFHVGIQIQFQGNS